MPRPVRSPDVAELRAFCAAVDLGSLGRAARLMRLSQPALSKRLRTLEALAGAKLLERSPRGVTPTPAGRRLYLEEQAARAGRCDRGADGRPVRRRCADPARCEPHDRRVR